MLRLVIPDTNEVVKDTLKCKILVNVKRPLIALQLVLQADKKEIKLELILVQKRNHALSMIRSNVRVKFRICEKSAAKSLLKAANFNKDSVYTRSIFLKGVGLVY